jgi:uncharacterized protein
MLMKIILMAALLAIRISASGQDPVNIMIATGGHDFDREAFFDMFDSFRDIRYAEVQQPGANVLIEENKIDTFDVLVFYDLYDSITSSQKKAYENLVQSGKALIFLHHALVSYQKWPGFINIIGGKYNASDTLKPLSVYQHDVEIPVQVLRSDYPVTTGLKDFVIHDETYGNCIILPDVQPLLSTNQPQSLPYLAWVHKAGKSKVMYIQCGHGPEAFGDPNYRRLIHQAIRWSAETHRK